MESRVIAEGSSAAAVEAAGGNQGRTVLQGELLGILPVPGELLGILPVLGSPGRACKACWACCTDQRRRGCSP